MTLLAQRFALAPLDKLTQETKDALLRITVFEIIFGGGDTEMLDAKKDALLAAGARWDSSPATAITDPPIELVA